MKSFDEVTHKLSVCIVIPTLARCMHPVYGLSHDQPLVLMLSIAVCSLYSYCKYCTKLQFIVCIVWWCPPFTKIKKKRTQPDYLSQ